MPGAFCERAKPPSNPPAAPRRFPQRSQPVHALVSIVRLKQGSWEARSCPARPNTITSLRRGKAHARGESLHPSLAAIQTHCNCNRKQAVSRDSHSSKPQQCTGPPNPSASAFSRNLGGRKGVRGSRPIRECALLLSAPLLSAPAVLLLHPSLNFCTLELNLVRCMFHLNCAFSAYSRIPPVHA